MSFKAKVTYLYDNLTEDQKRAFCEGDLDLDDLFGDASELIQATRETITDKIKKWGKSQGFDE